MHAVVTGASRGVGAALAQELANRGARVSLVARDVDRLEALAKELVGRAVPADLSDPDVVSGLVARLETEEPVDVLINNAALPPAGRLAEMSLADLRRLVAVNFEAPLALCQQVLPGMMARDRGRIVNIGSLVGITAFPTTSVYGGAKAGLAQFTAVLQRELRQTPVRVMIAQLGEVQGTGVWEASMQAPGATALRDRLVRVGAMPKITPAQAARKIVEAMLADRQSVCIPSLVSPLHALRELPSRLTDFASRGLPKN